MSKLTRKTISFLIVVSFVFCIFLPAVSVNAEETVTHYINKYYDVTYNPDGTVITTHHIYDNQDNLVASIEGNGTATSTYYIHQDHLGGTNVVTDSYPSVAEVTDYLPFGKIRLDEQVSSFSEKKKFTGHEYDEDSELTYAKARYYEQDVGRFTSQDPMFRDWGRDLSKYDRTLEQLLSNPQELNSYSYVLNNPLKYWDPTGEDAVIKFNAVDKNITIRSTIFIHGKGATNEVASRMARNINQAWNQGLSYIDRSTDTTYSVNFYIDVTNDKPSIVDRFKDDSNFIEVGNTDRSYVSAGKANNGSWRDNEPDPAPHEFGHLIGLDDRYSDSSGVQSGWEGNIMAEPAMRGTVEQKNINSLISPYSQRFDNRWFSGWNKERSYHVAPRGRKDFH